MPDGLVGGKYPDAAGDLCFAYWCDFLDRLKRMTDWWPGKRATRSPYLVLDLTAGAHLAPVIDQDEEWIRVQLSLTNADRFAVFKTLRGDLGSIETELGPGLSWREENPPYQTQCQIGLVFPGVDPGDYDDWSRQHELLIQTLGRFRKVFMPRLADRIA